MSKTTCNQPRIPAWPSSGPYLIYSSNTTIRPVLTLDDIDDAGFRWDTVKEHYPDIELELRLEAGKIIHIEILKNESRNQVSEEVLKRGLTVLDDEDRIAVAHFRRAERNKQNNRRRRGLF